MRFLACLLLISLLVSGCSFKKSPLPTARETIKSVCFQTTCLAVEVVTSPLERARGLMFRTKLPLNKGMLFVFPAADYYSFWMKNTLLPLDIIWLDENGKIITIKRDAPPCPADDCPSFKPDKPARYVLEINAGMSDKINLATGNYLEFTQN